MPRPIRYCLPLHHLGFDDARSTMARLGPGFDRFELWVDTVPGWSDADLEALCRSRPGQLIIVWDRGDTDEDRRTIDAQSLLGRLAPLDVTIDLDLDRQPETLAYLSGLERTAALVVSHHDYGSTPDEASLLDHVARAKAASADIVKIATLCQSPEDALRLLHVGLKLKSQDIRHIVLGMGEHGVATRVFGTLWTNEWIYAPESAAAESAPHQLTRDQLGAIFDQLRTDRGGD